MLDSQNPAPRRPRFRRHRFGKPPFVFTERDRQVVRLVAEYRLLESSDIQLLVGGSAQNILRRLQALFHAGYLDRPRQQLLRGNGRFIYALGQAGADILNSEGGSVTRWAGNWGEKNRQICLPYIEHSLMISRFRVCLTLAARGGHVVMDRWLQGDEIRDHVIVPSERGDQRLPVCPDAYFVLKMVNEPEGRNRVHLFLEADRGTMTVKRFGSKLTSYWAYWRSGAQERKYGTRNFLVATVTRTPDRAVNLLAVARQVDAPRGGGLRMFMFVSEQEFVGRLERVLDAIWATPADDRLHSLLE
jgi:hypothetical protein